MELSTPQLINWSGEFGKEYTDRNYMTPEQADALCYRNYGVTRSDLNRQFLQEIPLRAKILEVGCNIGNQLLLLQKLGYSNLYGVEIQDYALELARSRAKGVAFSKASAFKLPYQDGEFDLVYTSGVLIHIAPVDLTRAMAEIHRCSNSYILGFEYYAPSQTEVNYRGHESLLWKMDYARVYVDQFKGLKLVMERQLRYLENDNIDAIFLLRKI